MRWYRAEKHPVEIALFGVHLEGKSSRVADAVSGALLARHGRKAHEERRLLADMVEKGRAGEFGDVVGDLELAIGTCTLGMDQSDG